METIYFGAILLGVLLLYAYSSIVLGKDDYVRCVEAGPTSKTDARRLKKLSFYDWHRTVKDRAGNVVDTSNMIRVRVEGNCMRPRHIETGDQLLVKKIDRRRPLRDQIQEGNILLIHLADTKVDKIRIFDRYDEAGQLITYRYADDGTRQVSTRPHREESVVGVVKYRV